MMSNDNIVLPTDWDLDNGKQDIMMIMDTATDDIHTSNNNDAEDESLVLFSNKQQESNHFFVLSGDQDPSNHSVVVDDVLMMTEDDEEDKTRPGGEEDNFPPVAGRLTLEQELAGTHYGFLDNTEDDDDNSFFTTNSGSEQHFLDSNEELAPPSFLPMDQRYQAMVDKLAESMKKSQETRKSLRIKTSETAEYNRWSSVTGTLSSIDKSSLQLQQYLKTQPRAAIM